MKNDMLIDNRSHEVWIERLQSLRTKRSWFERTKVLIKKKDIKAIVKNRLGEKVRKIEYIKRSKSGNDSFRVVLKNRSLKCYESWTSRHTQRVAVISNTLINNDIPFPKVFFTQNRYVVAEWIEGTVPFFYPEHPGRNQLDYWRFTLSGLKMLFRDFNLVSSTIIKSSIVSVSDRSRYWFPENTYAGICAFFKIKNLTNTLKEEGVIHISVPNGMYME